MFRCLSGRPRTAACRLGLAACATPVLMLCGASAQAQTALQGTVLSASQSASSTTGSFANPSATTGRAIGIPANSLRGEVVFGQPPEVTLNGQSARLSPGARIRNTDNLLVLSGRLVGQKWKVNYTTDSYGLLMGVWLLSANEAAKLWPTSAKEAATWTFDPVTGTWSKP